MDKTRVYGKEVTAGQAEEIYKKYLKADFPPAEVKPFAIIRKMMRKESYVVYGFYEKGDAREEDVLCAYAFLLADHEKRMLLLDYFAVCGHLRGAGYGSCVLAMLREKCADWNGILIEVEDDEMPELDEEMRRIRKRRIAFYADAGCRMTTTRSRLWEVDYRIMVLPLTDTQAEKNTAEKVWSIYRGMYTDGELKKHFAITAQ